MGRPRKVLLEREFLKRWLTGLHACNSHNKDMAFWERKGAIKLSADMAMASTPANTHNWRRAVIESASKDDDKNKAILKRLYQKKGWIRPSRVMPEVNRSKKILRRSRIRRILRTRANMTTKKKEKRSGRRLTKEEMLKRSVVVKKRTQVLRRLIPGGEDITDDGLLMQETLDYVVSIRAQVDVMRRLADSLKPLAHLLDRK